MNISFLFTGVGGSMVPSGGYKMVYEYANRLTQRGHHINLIYHCDTAAKNKIPINFLRKQIMKLIVKISPRWFELSSQIRSIATFSDTDIPDADVIIATAITTPKIVQRLPSSKGNKVYFIQDFETWDGNTEHDVYNTYRMGMKNIVIAKWLRDKVHIAEAECVLIPNGIDFDVYNIKIPINKRKNHTLAMLYHVQEHKGAKYGIQAIKEVKKIYKDLTVNMFGVPDRPKELPEWINYTKCANSEQLREIYNNAAVFLCPSIKEGFGLTGAEAMACGCAYVASDYGGVHEYAEEGRNVLLSKPKDISGIVKNITYLFEHDEERIRLAEQGYQDIQKLDWNKSVDKFEAVISGAC